MITKSKQAWEVGQTVKVGFLSSLVVTAKVITPGDYAPDAYILRRNEQLYKFVPHNGLEKISLDEAAEMVAAAKVHVTRGGGAEILAKAASAPSSFAKFEGMVEQDGEMMALYSNVSL
jgi:hypothetical protein